MTASIMYRYQESLYSRGDEDSGFTTYVSVYLQKYTITKETPKGKWIELFPEHSGRRFVLNHGRKRYAHETEEKAKQSFIARKQKQIRIMKTNIRLMQDALRQVGVKSDS